MGVKTGAKSVKKVSRNPFGCDWCNAAKSFSRDSERCSDRVVERVIPPVATRSSTVAKPTYESRLNVFYPQCSASIKPSAPRSIWKDSLWRTYDLLTRFGYTGCNFETHTPTYLTKKRILEAFSDFITEDPWYGPMAITAIMNHAHKKENTKLYSIIEENCRGASGRYLQQVYMWSNPLPKAKPSSTSTLPPSTTTSALS